MFLTEQDSGNLKKWIIKRLDSNLDADPEILADYIIALLKHDGDEESVRNICLSEIPDFLESKEGKKCDPVSFVNDILDAIYYRAYLPGKSLPEIRGPRPQMTLFGHMPDQSAVAIPNTVHPPAHPPPQPPPVATVQDSATGSGSRKRAFQDVVGHELPTAGQNLLEAGGRPAKQLRSLGTRSTAYQKAHLTQHLTETNGLPSRSNPTAVPTSATHACAQSTLAPPSDPRLPNTNASSFENQHLPYSHDHQGLLYLQPPHPPPPGYPTMPTVRHEATPQAYKRGRRVLCKAWRTSGFCPRGTACKFAHIVAPKTIPNTEQYDPRNPLLAQTGLSSQQYSFSPRPHQLERLDSGALATTVSHSAQSGTEETRGGFSADGVVHSRNATTVVVEKIPVERFNESAIRTFFLQFGNIIKVNLQMGSRKIAIVKYETHDSALAALKSPKAVFDNRFVQVNWYNDANASSLTNGDLLGSKVGRSTGNGKSPPEFDLGAFFRRQKQAQKEFEDRKRARQDLEEERRKVEQRRKELQEQKKNYLEQCAAKGLAIDDESDDGDSGDITISTGGDKENQVRPFPVSKEALKAKLAEVEAEARRLGIDPDDDTETVVGWVPPARGGYRGRFATRGYFRGGVWGRGGFLGSIHEAYARYSIDNRPKSVLLTGVDFSAPREDEALRHHLLSVGEFASIENGDFGTTVHFKDRKSAEQFYNSVDNMQIPGSKGNVEAAWVANSSSFQNVQTKPSAKDANKPVKTSQPDEILAKEEHKFDLSENATIDYDVADGDEWANMS